MKLLFLVAASLGTNIMDGQAIKDPVESNPVLVSSRAQLIASLEQGSVRIGDRIILHYRLKNVSSGMIPLVYNDFSNDSWLMVTDASGTELPRTKEGDRLRQPSTGLTADVVCSLGPTVEDADRIIDVSKLYQLDRPGKYFVRIARRMGLPPGVPFPKYPEIHDTSKAPLEEAVSELIPFAIVP